MIEILKEVTEWKVEYKQPNHTYLVNKKGHILAFAKWHSNEIDIIKSKMILNKRYRKFIKDNHSGLSQLIPQFNNNQEDNNKLDYDRLFKVKSKNKEYNIIFKDNRLTCECIGFNYRGKCKHADVVKKRHFPELS